VAEILNIFYKYLIFRVANVGVIIVYGKISKN